MDMKVYESERTVCHVPSLADDATDATDAGEHDEPRDDGRASRGSSNPHTRL